MTMIATMTPGHIRELMRYESELFGPEAWSADGYRDELADRRHRRYVVALDETGRLLGWAGIRVLADEGEILTVGVVPSTRRRGVARRLIAALLEEARTRSVTEVFLEVRIDNEAARALYKSEGFEPIGLRRGYYEHGRVDAITMRKSLETADG